MKRKSIIIFVTLMLILVGCGNSASNTSDDTHPNIVENRDVTVTLVEGEESLDIDGKYTVEMVKSKPQGEGEFTAEGDENALYEYEGSFADGYFDGYGVTTITDNEGTLIMEGTYTKGEFTPTIGESFNYIGQFDTFGKFSVPDTVIEYIDSNTDIFPKATKEIIQSASIQAFSNKQFIKTRKQDEVGLVKLDLYVVQVFEDDFLSGKLTSLLATDEDANCYALYYLDTAEVYEGDSLTAYAVPCATSSFDNIGGGTTNVVVMAVSYIE